MEQEYEHDEPMSPGGEGGGRTRRMKRKAAEQAKKAAKKTRKGGNAKGRSGKGATSGSIGKKPASKSGKRPKSNPPTPVAESNSDSKLKKGRSNNVLRNERDMESSSEMGRHKGSADPSLRLRSLIRENNISGALASEITACLSQGADIGGFEDEKEESDEDTGGEEEAGVEDGEEEEKEDEEEDEEEPRVGGDNVLASTSLGDRSNGIDGSDEEHDLSTPFPETVVNSDLSWPQRTERGAATEVPSISSGQEPLGTQQRMQRTNPDLHMPKMGWRNDESFTNIFLQKIEASVNEIVGKRLEASSKKFTQQLEKVSDLRNSVLELTNIVTTVARTMYLKQVAVMPRQKEIHNTLCLLPALFNDEFILRSLSKCIMFSAMQQKKGCQTLQSVRRAGSGLFSILFFSRQPGEKTKEKFASETGRKFSKFKTGVILTSFVDMQKNSYGTFRSNATSTFLDTMDNNLDPSSVPTDSLSTPFQPFWLKPGYVLAEHCFAAATKFEKTSVVDTEGTQSVADSEATYGSEQIETETKQKGSRSGPITREEIAIEASCIVYKIITSVLYRARSSSKLELFQSLTYLFSGWSQFKTQVKQDNLKLKWAETAWESPTYMDALPKTHVLPEARGRRHNSIDAQQVDVDNLKLLEKVIRDHPELVLIVEHDVIVEGMPKAIMFHISMIEVGCKFFSSFLGTESHARAKDALNRDKNSFTLILLLAIGLRRLLERAVHDLNEAVSVPWSENTSTSTNGKRGRPKKNPVTESTPSTTSLRQYSFEVINGLSINSLLPAPTKQRDLLQQMILNLSNEEYLSKSQGDLEMDMTNGGRNEIQLDDNLFDIL